MSLPKLHEVLVLGKHLPPEDRVEVEVVAVDPAQQAVTVYNALEDTLDVLLLNGDRFTVVKFTPAKEPWQA